MVMRRRRNHKGVPRPSNFSFHYKLTRQNNWMINQRRATATATYLINFYFTPNKTKNHSTLYGRTTIYEYDPSLKAIPSKDPHFYKSFFSYPDIVWYKRERDILKICGFIIMSKYFVTQMLCAFAIRRENFVTVGGDIFSRFWFEDLFNY